MNFPQYLHLLSDAIVPPLVRVRLGYGVHATSGGTFSFVRELHRRSPERRGQELELRLMVRSASHGVGITSLSTGSISDQGSLGMINIGNLYADEEKEFLVDLTVSACFLGVVSSLLDIGFRYKDAVSEEAVEIEGGNLVEIRRSKVVSFEETVVSVEAQEMAEEGKGSSGRGAECGAVTGCVSGWGTIWR